mmetsp:Transcript_69038/g.194680  ORF Transcript_69038/g.194680 Transcript_69038/m.194680 type:complete len:275 (+) Transcript_69038:636-1460(+)
MIASMAALPMHPARTPISMRGPTPKPTMRGVRTAYAPGASISLTDDLVEIMTHLSLSGTTSSSSLISPVSVTCLIASRRVLPFAFFTSRNWRRTSWIISAAALPTDIIVRAAKKKGSMQPMSAPARSMGSLISNVMTWPFATSCLKAARSDSAVSTADPTAKPLPIAAVVLPRASRASVFSRTLGPRPAISARPPALSATGPYASLESWMASVPSIPTAASATPYSLASSAHRTMVTARIAVGRIVLTIPTPMPWMITVAGPVRARSLIEIVGP